MEFEHTLNRNKHRPFHIYSGHTYFVTGRCYDRIRYFATTERKKLFLSVLHQSIERFHIKLYAWALLDNHYHMLFSALPYVRTDFASAQSVTPNGKEGDGTIDKANNARNERSDELTPPWRGKFVIMEFMRKLHKDTARLVNQEDGALGRQVWYQYWDYCIRNKPDFWKHFNYIFQQPLKHGLVRNLPAAAAYQYSSNREWVERFTPAGMSECLEKYPVRDWTPSNCD